MVTLKYRLFRIYFDQEQISYYCASKGFFRSYSALYTQITLFSRKSTIWSTDSFYLSFFSTHKASTKDRRKNERERNFTSLLLTPFTLCNPFFYSFEQSVRTQQQTIVDNFHACQPT